MKYSSQLYTMDITGLKLLRKEFDEFINNMILCRVCETLNNELNE